MEQPPIAHSRWELCANFFMFSCVLRAQKKREEKTDKQKQNKNQQQQWLGWLLKCGSRQAATAAAVTTMWPIVWRSQVPGKGNHTHIHTRTPTERDRYWSIRIKYVCVYVHTSICASFHCITVTWHFSFCAPLKKQQSSLIPYFFTLLLSLPPHLTYFSTFPTCVSLSNFR